MKISPVNISVHTTNPELRCRMMHNRFAGEALKIMDRFAEAGIAMNAQLVLCPGINDGAELERSLHRPVEAGPRPQDHLLRAGGSDQIPGGALSAAALYGGGGGRKWSISSNGSGRTS